MTLNAPQGAAQGDEDEVLHRGMEPILLSPQSSPLAWVESSATAGDDLDPDVTFGSDGRPHLVWWRNENGVGRVYLSLYLVTRWMPAYPVSDPGVDSINPEVTVLSDNSIQVDYDTPGGHVTRTITFNRPLTITDDIEPFGRMNIMQTTTTPTLH